MWSQKKSREKLHYTHPESRGPKLVQHPQDRPWSSWSFYAKGKQGLIQINEVTPRARVVQKPHLASPINLGATHQLLLINSLSYDMQTEEPKPMMNAIVKVSIAVILIASAIETLSAAWVTTLMLVPWHGATEGVTATGLASSTLSAARSRTIRFPESPFFAALIHHSPAPGNSALAPLRPAPHTTPTAQTFSSRHYNFNCGLLIIPGVKLIALMYSGLLLPLALTSSRRLK